MVNAKPGEEDTVFCPRCEIDMKPYVKTSEVAAAAANAPSSSGGVAAATKTKTTKAKTTRKAATAADGTPKVTKASKAKATRAAKAAAAAPVPQPDFGDFRCLCCGLTKTVALGTEKPAGGWRCPTCFVKLAWLKS